VGQKGMAQTQSRLSVVYTTDDMRMPSLFERRYQRPLKDRSRTEVHPGQ
jgi:hypothetical protein